MIQPPRAPWLRTIAHSLVALPLGLAAATASAESPYPKHPITIIVPFQAGGGADLAARLMAAHMSKYLGGQSLVVENRPGASGNIGAGQVARAAADGYTLLITNNTMSINASLGLIKNYDIRASFQPISLMVSSPVAIGVTSSLPITSISELVADARKKNGKLDYSTCGNGTPQHFTGAAFGEIAKLDMVQIPYSGCAPAVTAGLGGQVPVLFSTVANLASYTGANGKLRMLGVVSKKRLSFMPDVPTVAETPEFKDLDISVWFGLFAPKGLPPEVLKQLETAALSALAEPALKKEFSDRYYEVNALGANEMAAQLDKDLSMYSALAKSANIKLE